MAWWPDGPTPYTPCSHTMLMFTRWPACLDAQIRMNPTHQRTAHKPSFFSKLHRFQTLFPCLWVFHEVIATRDSLVTPNCAGVMAAEGHCGVGMDWGMDYGAVTVPSYIT